MLKTLGLSLLMLCVVAVALPIAESQAGRGASASWHRGNKRMTRRQRQAYLRRRRAALRRKRLLARRRAEAAAARAAAGATNQTTNAQTISASVTVSKQPQFSTPAGWNGGYANGAVRWQVAGAGGTSNVHLAALGAANLDAELTNTRYRTLGGYTHAELRRQVIDRMIAEGGWVTNDAERTIGGHRMFVVQAANGDPATPRQWTFYFAVVGDRLYRLTADSPERDANRLTAEVEALVASLRAQIPATLTAKQ